MIHIERRLTIDAAPDAVWAVLSRFMQIDEFAPEITSVDALTSGDIGVGSKRRNHFKNGTSLVEEVTGWTPGTGYTVRLSDMAAMPLHKASGTIHIAPAGAGSSVTWTFDFRVKYGPIGWLLGQTVMKGMMGKILMGNLKGLAGKAGA
ncbi:MAG: SRPBCC family protein [Pseudomonadota bacterium]